MAGVKGRSGGHRPNTGGARAGSGRKKKPPQLFEFSSNGDPKAFLTAVMNDQAADVRLRVQAAKLLMPFVHVKLREGGKKEQQAEAAKRVSHGLFSLRQAPPKLVRSNDR